MVHIYQHRMCAAMHVPRRTMLCMHSSDFGTCTYGMYTTVLRPGGVKCFWVVCWSVLVAHFGDTGDFGSLV